MNIVIIIMCNRYTIKTYRCRCISVEVLKVQLETGVTESANIYLNISIARELHDVVP